MPVPTPQFTIPDSELTLSVARSSGPGGQNVNKVNSKVVLRWNLVTSPSVPEAVKARLLARLGPRLTREGELIVASDRYRDQPRNREDCVEKLAALLAEASAIPKHRKKTKPTRGSVRRKREGKSRHSDKKSMRGRVRD